MTNQEFLSMLRQCAINDMRSTKILASLTGAQAIIESNWGKSGLAVKGNNLFGIKGTYNGQSITMPTTEYYNGVKTRVNAAFRKYPSWQESINDHSKLFLTSKRYANLIGCTDYRLACKYVKEDGYATSPTYTQTLINCIEKYRLYEWDNEVLNGTSTVTATNTFTRNLKRDTRGEDVVQLQRLLNSKNNYKLKEDGIFGPCTEAAIVHIQWENNLRIDGIVGPKTISVLMG